MSVQDWIRETVATNPIVLFMKGNAQAPQCGFSAKVVQILQSSGVKNLATVDVLANEEVRQGIKTFANWPTIPQLYINGEFIGGADIVSEMQASGELKKLLEPLLQNQAG